MVEKILITVDGSDHSRQAATVGFKLATTYDVAVDVLHAIENASSADDANEGDQGQHGQADKILDDISAIAADVGVTVGTYLVAGQPPEVIVSQASESGADLVVMGRQGQTGVGERLLGSVTERVLRHTGVPVLIVSDDDSIGTDGMMDAHVLASTDGSETAERAAPYAADIA